jgi:hypothetical protein
MRKRFIATIKRHEIYVVAAVIGVVFLSAMGIVAWVLQTSMETTPYESLSGSELTRIFATGYVRFREDDRTPYLKVELHNGTLWWIKKIEFDFDGARYILKDPDAFRPLRLGAVRCSLKKPPSLSEQIEFDLRILKAYGYPPASHHSNGNTAKLLGSLHTRDSAR